MFKTQIFKNDDWEILRNELIHIYKRDMLPVKKDYMDIIKKVNQALLFENKIIRPRNRGGFPGGIIYLKKDLPTIIIPDLHSRGNFFLNVLLQKDSTGMSNLQKLSMNLLQIVCVGDGIHSEERGAKRWLAAFEEYKDGFDIRSHMDDEMIESFNLMEMVMRLKSAYAENFHFLKGNHENIMNENINGNHPFGKFTYEGMMVFYYVKKFFGNKFLNLYSTFEKSLPLLAVGKNFLISHAEPEIFYHKESLLNYRSNPHVIEGLTWTDNGAAQKGSVEHMLKHYLEDAVQEKALYFTGHRAINNNYKLRAGGKLVQIHNPAKFNISYIKAGRDIDLKKDILEIPDILSNQLDDTFIFNSLKSFNIGDSDGKYN